MEIQDRSVEARPCGESGEETTTETSLPLGDHLQELPSRFQRGQTFRTTRLMRVDHPFKPVTKGIGPTLQEHGPRFIQCPRQAAQPGHHSPDQTVIDHRLARRWRGTRGVFLFSNRITDQRAIVPYTLAIRNAWLLEIPLRSGQQTGCGKSLIRQYESWGSR